MDIDNVHNRNTKHAILKENPREIILYYNASCFYKAPLASIVASLQIFPSLLLKVRYGHSYYLSHSGFTFEVYGLGGPEKERNGLIEKVLAIDSQEVV